MALGKGGALPYLGPPSGASGFGLCRAGLSQRCANIRVWACWAGVWWGSCPSRPKCLPLALPLAGSLLLFFCIEAGPRAGGVLRKVLAPQKRRKQQDGTCTLAGGKPPPAPGRGRAAEGGARGEEVEAPVQQPLASDWSCLPSIAGLPGSRPEGAPHQWDRFRSQAGAFGDLAWTCPLGQF